MSRRRVEKALLYAGLAMGGFALGAWLERGPGHELELEAVRAAAEARATVEQAEHWRGALVVQRQETARAEDRAVELEAALRACLALPEPHGDPLDVWAGLERFCEARRAREPWRRP